MTPRTWIRQFISKCLDITHSQWIYRNYTMHHRHNGTIKLKEHEDILRKINAQLNSDPADIPDHSRYLLEIDHSNNIFDKSLEDQQYGLFAIKAARSAGARTSRRRRLSSSSHTPREQSRRCQQVAADGSHTGTLATTGDLTLVAHRSNK